jgi:hypothetical protein
MSWRLYDVINCQWFNDELYASREACTAAAEHYRQAAHSEGEVLELLAQHVEPSEAYTMLQSEDEEA